MKKNILAVAVLAMAVAIIGCGGQRHATLRVEKDGAVTHDDWNASLLQPSVGPTDMAVAYSIKKDADTREAMMLGLMKGQVNGGSGEKAFNYVFALINNDRWQAIYIDHPEMPSTKVTAQPGGNPEFIFLRDIPYKILYRRVSDGKIIKEYTPQYDYMFREKMSHKKRINGILVDFVLRVDQVS